MAFRIEKGIPLPPKAKPVRRRLPPVYAAMEVGDSFFVRCGVREAKKVGNREAINGRIWSKRHGEDGAKFSYRPVEGGVRVWRVK